MIIQFELDSFYTATELVNKLLEGDGAGSGLDADLLDGQHGAYYLPAGTYTASDILTKLLTVDGHGTGLDADLLDGTELSKILALGATIPGSANLNNYNATGLYHQPSTANAGSGTNYPVALAGVLEVIADGTFIYQKYTAYDSAHNVYVRTCDNGTWYTWTRILDTADLTTINNNLALKLNAATYTAADILAKLLTVDGSGCGLDADTLDGVQYSTINSAIAAKLASSSYTAADVLAKLLTVDGAGCGLDADKLDGQEGAYYLPAETYTASDILTKLKTVDGAGSGLDADLVDGTNPSPTGGTANAIVKSRSGGTLDPNYLPFSDKSGTFQIPKLIENATLSSVTSKSFTGLSGWSSYILELIGTITSVTSQPYLTSNLSNNWVGWQEHNETSSAQVTEDGAISGRPALCAGINAGDTNYLKSRCEITSENGLKKWFKTEYQFKKSGYVGGGTSWGFNDDISTAFTSIVANFGGTFSGIARLYKLVDLVIA